MEYAGQMVPGAPASDVAGGVGTTALLSAPATAPANNATIRTEKEEDHHICSSEIPTINSKQNQELISLEDIHTHVAKRQILATQLKSCDTLYGSHL
jgi:hypothetical protein